MSTLRKRHLNPDWLRHTSCMHQHRNKLYRVTFYEVAYRRVCYSAEYNGGLFYKLLGEGGALSNGQYRSGWAGSYCRVAELHAKDHFTLSASSQYLHTFIHFVWQYQECRTCQPNLALILKILVRLMSHSRRYLFFKSRFNPIWE